MTAGHKVEAVSYALTVIIAEEMAVNNLAAIFLVLQPQLYTNVEFLVCSASDPALLDDVPIADNVRIIVTDVGARIPLLWRDGIEQAGAEKLALTTAQCIPSAGWIKKLLDYSLSDKDVAVGGAISNRENDNAVGRAIYLLRYVNYTQAKSSAMVDDIAADNAVYSKAAIMAHPDLLQLGFWEPSFHQRFIAEGRRMKFDNTLEVVHSNCYSVKQFCAQRYSHGVEFGRARAKSMLLFKRLIMIVLSPLIPLVFLRKILVKARCDRQFNFAPDRDFFWLMVFILAWAAGETVGYIKK